MVDWKTILSLYESLFQRESKSGLLACFCMNDRNVGLLLPGFSVTILMHLLLSLVICVAARGAQLPGWLVNSHKIVFQDFHLQRRKDNRKGLLSCNYCRSNRKLSSFLKVYYFDRNFFLKYLHYFQEFTEESLDMLIILAHIILSYLCQGCIVYNSIMKYIATCIFM